MRRLLELNPDILKIPDVKKEVPDVMKRLKSITKEMFEYSIDDRFKLGFEIGKDICLNDRILSFLVNHFDGVLISGILRGALGKKTFVKLKVKRKINYIGYKLKRGKVLIIGDAGNKLGCEMEGGEIVVEGNAGNWVGEKMKGGMITVKGNVGSYLGLCMENGRIVVEGNAGYGVGEKMSGGEITVKGDAKKVGREMRGGVIRVFGKVQSFGYRGAGKVYYWKDGKWKERDVDYYIYYR